MRKSIAGIVVGVALVAWMALGQADARTPAGRQTATGNQTVTGQVVCLVCYARNKQNVGMDHDVGRVCARACVKWEGNPVGLVTDDGAVFQLAGGLVANNNAKAAAYVAHRVTVTGEVFKHDGMTMLRADDAKPVK
jgi:hypothetical protein